MATGARRPGGEGGKRAAVEGSQLEVGGRPGIGDGKLRKDSSKKNKKKTCLPPSPLRILQVWIWMALVGYFGP